MGSIRAQPKEAPWNDSVHDLYGVEPLLLHIGGPQKTQDTREGLNLSTVRGFFERRRSHEGVVSGTAHHLDSQLNEGLNCEATAVPQTHCCAPQTFLNHFRFATGHIIALKPDTAIRDYHRSLGTPRRASNFGNGLSHHLATAVPLSNSICALAQLS